NMVLGIDEYWSEKERDEHTDFTILKKFAQRILKNTGNESYKYLKEIRSLYEAGKNIWTGCGDMTAAHPDGVSYIYVFGHSLDITDRDVLADFIGDEATSVRIFCRDKGTEGELMANVIRLIGEDGLINKRYHVPTKLDFIIPKHTKAE
ncbi:MAG: hypothetical protein J6K26_05920, partial [Lachnospiraceae bacterium]|nr:hypothetical protein [Lachnospiraceae bacterium]